jgi:alkanesulfonate monooxygenase SsuD/methylene tetrahydromethanopterin reductase-like flavin-dependent oxidoreductase (luciferase family)
MPSPSAGRPLKVGFQLPEVERVVRWPEVVELARLGESIGFDSVWTGDHLLYRSATLGARGPWEAWTTLAGLAASTSRIAIGPLVACTSFHNPAMLAKMAATVDEISGGRLILGLGAGWNETEFRAFGFPFDQRVSRFEEAFTIIRGLLRGGRVDFEGAYYRVEDCVLDPGPARPGGPPLMLGSTRPRMMRIGLSHVDAWNVWWSDYGNTPGGFAAVRDRVDEAAVQAGRLPGEVTATAAVLVSLPGAEARAPFRSCRTLRCLPSTAAMRVFRMICEMEHWCTLGSGDVPPTVTLRRSAHRRRTPTACLRVRRCQTTNQDHIRGGTASSARQRLYR